MLKRISCDTAIICLTLGLAGCALDTDAEEPMAGESAVPFPFGTAGRAPSKAEALKALGAGIAAKGVGVPSVWGPAEKSFLGTSTTSASRV